MSQYETRFLYPIKSNLQFVRPDEIKEYLSAVFCGVEWGHGKFAALRGVGEKRTPKEGTFREDIFLSPHVEDLNQRTIEICSRWAQYHVAAFIVPCVLKEARGTAENVLSFSQAAIDLDSGNTDHKMQWLCEAIGEPSMVIVSGGTTEEGTAKRHVYYCLEEPCLDIPAIVKMRDMIARKVAADPMLGLGVESNILGRSHQPLRIAGTCHAKGGEARSCHFEHRGPTHPLQKVIEGVERMGFAPWVDAEKAAQSQAKIRQMVTGSLFSPTSGREPRTELDVDVYEGSDDPDRNRWIAFNRSAGHFIRRARDGVCTVEGAREAAFGWVSAHMVPPWPDHRVSSEFQALLNRDIAQNGPMEKREAPTAPRIFEPVPEASESVNATVAQPAVAPATFDLLPSTPAAGGRPAFTAHEDKSIMRWAAHKWATSPKPKHAFLVDRLVIRGEPHLFVAEGGSGKTFQALDLAMKVASWAPGDNLAWCGQKIMAGGSVVLILCEDSMTETHIRLVDIDKTGLIERAGDKLIVIPMTSNGGAFPLAGRDPMTGLTKSSPKWDEMMENLKKLPNLALVVIDTFNSVAHADENSAHGIAEMMREAHRVCGELQAALVFNHHIRKEKEALKSLKELEQSIRGSSAIPSYFRVCLGMFHAGDYDRRMRAMGLRPEKLALWRFGIAKCNINGLMRGERTLLRNSCGLLEDVTAKDKFNMANMAEREAWLVFAIEQAALAGHPYGTGGKNAKGGIFARRSELPPILRKMGDYEFHLLAEDAMQAERITQCAIKGGNTKSYFDVPYGPLAIDSFGGEINKGAYAVAFDWDDYGYCQIENSVMLKSKIRRPFSQGPAVWAA